MPVQQISADPPNQDQESFAALQRNFPKPDAHSLPNRQNPIRPVAAPGADVSHAGQTSPMLMQRHPPCLLDRITDLTAAAQHDFPKPDIQIV